MPKKPIDHYEHPDTLPNNPTQELSGFAEDEENAPTRYRRDAALDPQLVWKGKDQQNDSDLEVHTVPIYTQEHIQPQAIIENLRAQKRKESDQPEMFFEGFNDLDFSQKIEFYQHEQHWRNRFISGDSLAVMNSLAEKEHLKGQVQMIYFDPPYGIKHRVPKFDLLIVMGFAFEGYTADENTRMGPLTILPVKMSPELMVRELKNTGEGNLFMVFGEPDVEIETHQDDTVSVKLLGVDVYNPREGLVHSHTPEDIACWFIDTAYTGEAFFVRPAYFTGADEPYKQLQRALNSEIDGEAWEALYRTESLPFAKPETGKIAVKVINHYGDEVMKEYKA